MKDAANQFVTAMQFFVTFFPQFKNHTTMLAGESYAGKFVPLYIYYMLEANVHSKVGEYWHITGAFMGDPYIAPLSQRSHMYIVPEALDIIDESNMD